MTDRRTLVVALILLLATMASGILGYQMGVHRILGPQPTQYLSSMGIWDPITGLIRVRCSNGKENFSRDVRSLGIATDADHPGVLMELNDAPPDQYSKGSEGDWIAKGNLCQAYVTNAPKW